MTEPTKAPSPVYLCFTAKHDEADALRRYRERFGTDPEEMFSEKLNLWLGPIPQQENVLQ